jgi:16S rRNA (cytidine1402-2'-O)-methyltransferase
LTTIDSPLLLQAARAAAGGQQYPAATLYVVATPIGNLADLTLRAIQVLSLVDAVAGEDTRVTAGLLRHLGLDKPLLALHEHNEVEAAASVLRRLQAGERVAYVSDAGTPGVSDPGARLAQRVQQAGLRVLPLPGASAVVTALSAAGSVHGAGFRFAGFLPAKGAERASALQAVVGDAGTTVLFEAPHRIGSLLQALAEGAPARDVTVCRELTKQFETIVTRPAAELPAWLDADPNHARGEFVLVLHAQAATPAAAVDTLPAEAEHTLALLLPALPLKQAVALAAEITRAPRNALYQRALALRDAAQDDGDAP